MSKRLHSKYKIDRRQGANIWGRARSPVNKREYRPGQHTQRRGKPTDYGIQLMAKQRLKGYYGNIGEKQFRKIYQEAERLRGDTAELLLQLLERRLDAVIYRMKFVATVFAARQFVNHGHVRVNGRRVTVPSYRLREGDQIEISGKAKQFAFVMEALKSSERDVPAYIQVDGEKGKGSFVRAPAMDEVPYPVRMEPNLVIEFYSR
ncbi:MAG: 30S ribosomal protein S4 [Alphaproteobacteria bacterium]|nr:MAG: 30S ribosomal protein S4 [Alphaproteobacteria bacterium]